MFYEVDAAAGVCTCPAGMCGECCKHQVAVYKWFGEVLPNIPAVTDADRYSAACIALGESVSDREFYKSRLTNFKLQLQHQLAPAVRERWSWSCMKGQHPQQPTNVIETWKTLSLKMEQLIAHHSASCDESDLHAGMNVHTGSQLTALLHSFGHVVPRRRHVPSSCRGCHPHTANCCRSTETTTYHSRIQATGCWETCKGTKNRR